MHVYMYACWEVRKLLAEGQWFPPGTPVSYADKTDRHNMTQDIESGVKHKSIQKASPQYRTSKYKHKYPTSHIILNRTDQS